MPKYRGPLCHGDNKSRWLWENEPYDEQKIDWFRNRIDFGRPRGVKHPWVRCPVCGRRIKLSIAVSHEGLYGIIPSHKPKKWWKKRKKKTKKHGMSRTGRKG